MSLHYRPILLSYYLGSDLVEQPSEVAWVDQDEKVVVEAKVEAIN